MQIGGVTWIVTIGLVLALFSFVFVLFGLLLIYTGVQLFRHRDEDPDVENNLVVRTVRWILPLSESYDGGRLTTTVSGRRMATPLTVVLVAIGGVDLLFALDSIPAVFGITDEPRARKRTPGLCAPPTTGTAEIDQLLLEDMAGVVMA